MDDQKRKRRELVLSKSATGIRGLDEITAGGLPSGRPTLVCGGAGCGKTLFAMEFLIHGAIDHGEPGVFVSFEETASDLAENMASLGFDLPARVAAKQLAIDHVHIERSEIEETGEFDLEGLFIRLARAVDSIGAKRVGLDAIEGLFAGFPNPSIVRAELRRLFRWLKARGLTAVITGESGADALTRHGIEEYVSDCVIALDHRVKRGISTRHLRVVKYRGSGHGTNEYPFLIDDRGISVLPVTSLGLAHEVSEERIPTGIARLDEMLGGEGYYRGSSILVTGTAGCGKTSVAGHFAEAACRRKERCLYFLFEESPGQLVRNLRSVGIDLEPWRKKGLLRLHATRPSLYGLEMHLSVMLAGVREFQPRVVIVDPISGFAGDDDGREVSTMLVRLIDALKSAGITALLTNLTTAGEALERTESQISSLIDSWLLLRDIELYGERNRAMYVLKSRGMAHSNQLREFRLTDRGVELADPYVGPAGVLTGSARLVQEARDEVERADAERDMEQRRLALMRRNEALEGKIAALRAEFAADEAEATLQLRQAEQRLARRVMVREDLARSRGADSARSADGRPGRGAGRKARR